MHAFPTRQLRLPQGSLTRSARSHRVPQDVDGRALLLWFRVGGGCDKVQRRQHL